MARPEKTKELSHPHHITVRLTEVQYQTITEAAKEARLSRSDYIRQQLINGKVIISCDFRVSIPELQKLTSEYHNIGNNLNQIAKYFNTGGIHSQEIKQRINQCIRELFDLRKEVLKMAGDFRTTAKGQNNTQGGYCHGNTKTHRKQKR